MLRNGCWFQNNSFLLCYCVLHIMEYLELVVRIVAVGVAC